MPSATFVPGLSAQQIEFEQYCASHPDPWYELMQAQKEKEKRLQAIIDEIRKEFGPLLPQQSFVPQPITVQASKQPPKQEEEQQPLQQENAEKTAESISGIASSSRPNKSTLPTIPAQSTIRISGESSQGNKQLCRKWAPYTGFLATFLASSLASFGFLTTSLIASLFGYLLGYIRFAQDMEASGQG